MNFSALRNNHLLHQQIGDVLTLVQILNKNFIRSYKNLVRILARSQRGTKLKEVF